MAGSVFLDGHGLGTPLRPLVPRQVAREYIYAYTAVAPKTGEMVSLLLPAADTTMMNLFLQHVSRSFSNFFLVMQVAQAGWHQSLDLRIPENMRLIAQPAKRNELNPVEHIWEELREKDLPNRAFASLDAVIDKLCQGLQRASGQSRACSFHDVFSPFQNGLLERRLV